MGKAILLLSEMTADQASISELIKQILPGHDIDIDFWDAESIVTTEMDALLRRLSLRFDHHRVTVILQADLLSPLVQSKLLKPVEELSPDHSIILVTDKPASIQDSLRSRFEERRPNTNGEEQGDNRVLREALSGPLTALFSFTASIESDQIRKVLKSIDTIVHEHLEVGQLPETLRARLIAERSRCEAFPSRVTLEALLLTMRNVLNTKEPQ